VKAILNLRSLQENKRNKDRIGLSLNTKRWLEK